MRIVAALCCLVLLAGCGQQADPNAPGPQPPPPSSSTTTSAAGESPAGAVKTLRGKVEQGIEAGCMVLHTDDGDYLLMGSPATTIAAGTEVEVTGRVATDVMSICQQGEPFVVEKARKVG